MKPYVLLGALAFCTLQLCTPSFEETGSGLLYRKLHAGRSINTQKGNEYLYVDIRYEYEYPGKNSHIEKERKGDKLVLEVANVALPKRAPNNYNKTSAPKEIRSGDGGILEILERTRCGGIGAVMEYKMKAGKLIGTLLRNPVEPIRTHLGVILSTVPDKLFDNHTKQGKRCREIPEDAIITIRTKLKSVMTQEHYNQKEKEKQIQEELATIEQYLQDNDIKAQKSPAGFYYTIESPGTGVTPQVGSQVKVDYTGSLLNGTVFDTSVEHIAREHGLYNAMRPYEPLTFQLGAQQVIEGWDKGIALLKKGEKARLFIPSPLGYGGRGAGNVIPPNAILIFDVTLVDL